MDHMTTEVAAFFLAHKEYETMVSTEKGYGFSVKNTMMANPGYDVYVLLDNDFAMPIAQVPDLVAPILQGYDVVVGARQDRIKSHSPLRGILSRSMNTLFEKTLVTGLYEHFGGFRAYSARFVAEVLPYCNEKHWMFQPESNIAAQRLGYRVCEVPVSYNSAIRPTPLKRLPKDLMEIVPGYFRLLKKWRKR
jgi:hypothetical protein